MSDEQDTGDLGGGGSDGGAAAGGGAEGGGRFMLWVLIVIAVFVGGGVFYHLSSENAALWFLEVRDGEVVVRKGIWFPTGAADYDDGGPAYAPLPLPEGMDPPARVHDSSESVDNAIYRMLIALASAAIDSGDQNRIELAKGLLGRARLLAGISQEQADEVLRYRGDIAMAEGHLAIKEVAKLLTRAKQRVAAGASKGTRLYKDPQGWVRWIDAKLAEFTSLDDARNPPVSLCPPAAPAAPALAPAPAAAPAAPATPGDPAAAPEAPTAPEDQPAPASPLSELTGDTPSAPAQPAKPDDSGLSFPLFPDAQPSPAAPEPKPAAPAPAPAAGKEGEGEGEVRL